MQPSGASGPSVQGEKKEGLPSSHHDVFSLQALSQALTDATKEGPASNREPDGRASGTTGTAQWEEQNGAAYEHRVLSPPSTCSASNSQQQNQTAPSTSHAAQVDKGAARAAAYEAFARSNKNGLASQNAPCTSHPQQPTLGPAGANRHATIPQPPQPPLVPPPQPQHAQPPPRAEASRHLPVPQPPQPPQPPPPKRIPQPPQPPQPPPPKPIPQPPQPPPPAAAEAKPPPAPPQPPPTRPSAQPEPGEPSSSSSDEGELALGVPSIPPRQYRAAPESRQAPTLPRVGDSQVGLLYDESMELHTGPEHVEQPQRIIQVYMTLEEEGLLKRCWRVPTCAASDADLLLAHSPEHVAQIENVFDERPEENKDDEYIHTGLDLYACKDTALAARMATGCCIEALKNVLHGHVQAALAVVRPPGHHAECARAQGFCFYNNCAVAARTALAMEGVNRVLVLDWDVHHGNGIQEVLWEDPNVLYISLHRDPTNFYPYCAGFKHEVGAGPGTGFNINIPWTKRGMVDADYMAAFDMVVEPVVQSYQPDLVIVAAGFDAAKGDPLGGCKLTPQGYANMTKRLMAFAGGKIVLALEGGYNTRITADCAAACTRVLLGESLEDIARVQAEANAFEQDDCCMVMEPKDREVPLGEAIKTLKQVAAIQALYWPVLQEELVEARWKAHEKALYDAKRRK